MPRCRLFGSKSSGDSGHGMPLPWNKAVPASEASQMVAAVRANGVPAWSMLAADEGHGYSKKENQDYQFWTSLMFWKANLLGDEPR